MVTDAQNKANLGSATQLAKQSLVSDEWGQTLDLVAVSDWSSTDRVAFIQSLAAIILQYPERFSAETLSYAQKIHGTNLGGLIEGNDGSPSLASIFGNQLVDTSLGMGADIAVVGTSAINVLRNVAQTADNLSRGIQNVTATAGANSLSFFLIGGVALFVVLFAMRTEQRVSAKF